MNSLAISNLDFLKLLDRMIIVQFERIYNHCTHAIIRYTLCLYVFMYVDYYNCRRTKIIKNFTVSKKFNRR